jgi:hypothetical protein
MAGSPTDTPVLNHGARGMNMIWALIALTIALVVATRAINCIALF